MSTTYPPRDGKGRIAAMEIMLHSPLIADLIFKAKWCGSKRSWRSPRARHADLDQDGFSLSNDAA